MAQAQQGDTVSVHYTGRLEDGSVFDSSDERAPLSFTIGAGQVIPGFDQAVTGMTPGDKKTATMAADEAYGARRDDLVLEVDRAQIPPELDPEVGQQLSLTQADGMEIPVVVTQVTDDAVTLDANHPLAGKTLIFDIELVDIA